MSTPISDALSSLSDRSLRRLLGARTFLRGLEYFRRRIVEEIEVGEATASGTVRPAEGEPFPVAIDLTPEGIKSRCSCAAYQRAGQHCKHVAALLITVRDQARQGKPKQIPAPAPSATSSSSGFGRVPGHEGNGNKRRNRHERDRRRPSMPPPSSPGSALLRDGPPGSIVSFPTERLEERDRGTGLGAWLPDAVAPSRRVEFRMHVRQGALTVTVIDVDTRAPMLPSVALAWQQSSPTRERDALRLLAKFESGNPRHPAVDIRGEDVTELLPVLEPCKVLLEPALMQLRFSEDILRPRFELDTAGGETIVVKVSFERTTDKRKFSILQGGWFEGWPSWHIDTQEGIARRVDRRVSPAAMRRLLRTHTIAEPMTELTRVIVQDLPRVALDVGAELPDLAQVAEVVDLAPTFRLRAGGNIVEAEVSLFAEYGGKEIRVRPDGITPPVMVLPPEPGKRLPRCIRLDIAAQQTAAELLTDLGLTPAEGGEVFVAQGDAAMKFWADGLGTLPDDWDLFVPDDLVGMQVRSAPIGVFAKVSSGMDWLNVKVSYESEGVAVDRDELRRCLMAGKRYVKLEDGSFATFSPEQVNAILDREVELMQGAGKNGKLSLAQAGRVQELLEHVQGASVASATKALFEKLGAIDEIESAKKPRGLKATLRPYQESGLSWLRFIHELNSGGILADDMGLGKTIQTIALMLSVKAEEKGFQALIVAPTSVVTNWQRELEKFAPTLEVVLWHGADRKDSTDEAKEAHVIITSYALMRRDIAFLANLNVSYAILDEAQHIKNPLSATAAAAKKLNAKRRLALTGTPIENRLSEIWSIFDFVSPSLLGPLDKFESRFARPIEGGDYKTAQRLRAVIHPFILRRTKQEVAKDLPEKIETDQICDLMGEQKAVYNQIAREVKAQVMGEVDRVGLAKSQIHILAGLTRLRQASCDPRLLGLPKEFTDEDSGKLIALRELLANAVEGGHKVLVFSQFVMMLKLIEKALKADGITYEYLDGTTKDRQERVERFQNDPTVPVFLISLKAGGTGLNLTAADTVVHFDPWWNPAVEAQATDRAHRIGQSKVVTAYRFVAAGTIEEKILELKSKKKELISSVLSEDAGGMKKLTKSDLEDLFSGV